MSTQPPPSPPPPGGGASYTPPQYGPSQEGWSPGAQPEQMWAAPPVSASPYAGFGVRLVAYIVDGLAVGIPVGIIEAAVHTAAIYFLGAAASIAYFVYFWSTTGQTLGQRALGIRVVSADDGEVISPGRAFVRWLGIIIASIPLWLGLIWVAVDARKQGWHDKMANTVVVRDSAQTSER